LFLILNRNEVEPKKQTESGQNEDQQGKKDESE
jgi:hypothetical protein